MTEPRLLMPVEYGGRTRREGWLYPLIDPPFMDDTAHCAYMDVDVFYAPDREEGEGEWDTTYIKMVYEYARAVCEGCPFLDACREYAIAHETHGVWGGTTPHQRKMLRRERKWIAVETHEIPDVFTPENIHAWQHDTRITEEDSCSA